MVQLTQKVREKKGESKRLPEQPTHSQKAQEEKMKTLFVDANDTGIFVEEFASLADAKRKVSGSDTYLPRDYESGVKIRFRYRTSEDELLQEVVETEGRTRIFCHIDIDDEIIID